jgi:hypothetical protein
MSGKGYLTFEFYEQAISDGLKSFELILACSCVDLTNSFIEFIEVNETITNSAICIDFEGDDPCCNVTLEWEDCCFPEVRFGFNRALFFVIIVCFRNRIEM